VLSGVSLAELVAQRLDSCSSGKRASSVLLRVSLGAVLFFFAVFWEPDELELGEAAFSVAMRECEGDDDDESLGPSGGRCGAFTREDCESSDVFVAGLSVAVVGAVGGEAVGSGFGFVDDSSEGAEDVGD